MKLLNILMMLCITLAIFGIGMIIYAYFFTANIQLFLNGVLVTVAAGIALIVTLIISSIVEGSK